MSGEVLVPVLFVGGVLIAALTWLCSTWPRLYLRLFVPRNQWLGVARWAFRADYRRGLRRMAAWQLGAA